MNLGDVFPNALVETTEGTFRMHDYQGDKWLAFFSHPADFTPVCTTELARLHQIAPEFEKRSCRLIAYSCDAVATHLTWSKDINYVCMLPGDRVPYPIIADPNRDLAVELGMLDPVVKDKRGIPMTCRAIFIVAPDKTLQLSILYPASTGRNFAEVLRALDSLQLTQHFSVATPADWVDGDDVMILPVVSNRKAAKWFPGFNTCEVPSGLKYLRYTQSTILKDEIQKSNAKASTE